MSTFPPCPSCGHSSHTALDHCPGCWPSGCGVPANATTTRDILTAATFAALIVGALMLAARLVAIS